MLACILDQSPSIYLFHFIGFCKDVIYFMISIMFCEVRGNDYNITISV